MEAKISVYSRDPQSHQESEWLNPYSAQESTLTRVWQGQETGWQKGLPRKACQPAGGLESSGFLEETPPVSTWNQVWSENQTCKEGEADDRWSWPGVLLSCIEDWESNVGLRWEAENTREMNGTDPSHLLPTNAFILRPKRSGDKGRQDSASILENTRAGGDGFSEEPWQGCSWSWRQRKPSGRPWYMVSDRACSSNSLNISLFISSVELLWGLMKALKEREYSKNFTHADVRSNGSTPAKWLGNQCDLEQRQMASLLLPL